MDSKRVWITGLAILSVATGITATPWILTFRGNAWSENPANWGVFGDYIGGTLATILAAFSFLGLMYNVWLQGQAMQSDRELRDDEIYNKQAITCLERAFNRVYREGSSIPIRDRTAWLDCARFLLSADKLYGKIKSDGFKVMYESEREYWRWKFADLFEPVEDFEISQQSSYFDGPIPDEKIDHSSIYVIYSFSTWQKDQSDILEEVMSDGGDLNLVSKKYRGARECLSRSARFQQRVIEK